MPKMTLDYARPSPHLASRLLTLLASALLLYPFLLAATLYGHWLLVALALGHLPRPMLDDAPYPGRSLIERLLVLTWLGAVPFACAALALNLAHIAIHRRSTTPQRIALRLCLLTLPWLALLALLRWDPGQVFKWLAD
jgi:hypothetical protein